MEQLGDCQRAGKLGDGAHDECQYQHCHQPQKDGRRNDLQRPQGKAVQPAQEIAAFGAFILFPSFAASAIGSASAAPISALISAILSRVIFLSFCFSACA